MLRMHNRWIKFSEFSAQVHEYALQGKKRANQEKKMGESGIPFVAGNG